jgi:hypothetical protein
LPAEFTVLFYKKIKKLFALSSYTPLPANHLQYRARICRHLRSPRIDSKESVSLCSLAGRYHNLWVLKIKTFMGLSTKKSQLSGRTSCRTGPPGYIGTDSLELIPGLFKSLQYLLCISSGMRVTLFFSTVNFDSLTSG